ncbi:MAG: hypothetical protein Q7J55_03585 [bacterium]|nr:hypothetical protein [bacterium]
MPTPDELKALRTIDEIIEEGKKATTYSVAVKMRRSHHMATVILQSLGRADYIDLLASGECRITSKGFKALGKNEVEWWKRKYK